MSDRQPPIEELWKTAGFKPNDNQKAAILHIDGPLYLPAGPGSGKTRVLLWRTLNLIVYHGVSPDEIYLSTFTKKAAFQLQEGIRSLLSIVTNRTNIPYDISRMYVGTIHSLCQRLITDRRFSRDRLRQRQPSLLEALAQYFYVSRNAHWTSLTTDLGFGSTPEELHSDINSFFVTGNRRPSRSKHEAVINAISFFNRLSEECIDPESAITADDGTLRPLLSMYSRYLSSLAHDSAAPRTDFSLLQQEAFKFLSSFENSGNIFKHVIIDEYQDTNTIQEKIIFKLAEGTKNLCVVGDDDQALYRFRGATVENFVDFPDRCQSYLGCSPRIIPLNTNYRSRTDIITLYSAFIEICDWDRPEGAAAKFRVPKKITPHRKEAGPAVVVSTPGKPEDVCEEIATVVKSLLDSGKVENENQIAFLFPSLKTEQVNRFREALARRDIKVYAPRAGRFVEVEEAVAVFGIFLHIFGKPGRGDFAGQDYADYHDWIDSSFDSAHGLIQSDRNLAHFIKDRQTEIEAAKADFLSLTKLAKRRGWQLDQPYDPLKMKRDLAALAGLSDRTRKNLVNRYFDRVAEQRQREGRPVLLNYVLTRATSLDWTVLDLFYRLCAFDHFKTMFDLAESGEDEGPICNLGLITQYLAQFIDEYHSSVITADLLIDDRYQHFLFGSFLYAIFRLGESEYEDAEDPFPKGRIPFLTIHQAKGLEFPVVVFGNPRKIVRIQKIEEIVHPLLSRPGEPLDRMGNFDFMRLFYVALSRAKNLLIIPHWSSQGNFVSPPLRDLLDEKYITRIPDFDVTSVSEAHIEKDDLPKNYSFTGDYLLYQKCPRQYMIFRKYGFVPSRSQTMFFGSLVHQTLEDLHQFLIAQRKIE